jgi:hypothetical protein
MNEEKKIENYEAVSYYIFDTNEELIVIQVVKNGEIRPLTNGNRDFLKVIYTNKEGKTIKQAFYRSTGEHLKADVYSDVTVTGMNTKGLWFPTDGNGFDDDNGVVMMKSKFNINPKKADYENWLNKKTMIYKGAYYGKELTYKFREPVILGEDNISEYFPDDEKENRNFDMIRFGNETTLRISYLLSRKNKFWTENPLGIRIVNEYNFDTDHDIEIEIGDIDHSDNGDQEESELEINNFIADFISFNWILGDNINGARYFEKKRIEKNRKYDLRYAYMQTAKGESIMFRPYLLTNPDSREPEAEDSKQIRLIYDSFESGISETRIGIMEHHQKNDRRKRW